MPMYNKSGIAAEASKYGFQRDVFEKVLRLKITQWPFGSATQNE